MQTSNQCPSCGATLPGDLPAGLCAACLLAVGLPTEPPADEAAARRPTIRLSLPPLAEKPGDRIGRYKLLQQIGEGGCGVVYMADQEEPVKRRVALKVIKPGMDTREVLGRFEAERQALALMDHSNIAKVFDAGATETGRPFFVMELVRGIPITRYCDENKLNTDQRLELFIQVCQAIQHAHQKGIIHRDIKPSNILVADHDGVPVPKIIDFGIAKATSGQTLTDKTVFTALEQFIGTPAYMSPEQARLSGLDIDTRSDIYSLGVLLYELLTGKTPFDAKRLFEAGFDEIRRIIREEEPQRPSTKLSTLEAAEQTMLANQRHSEPPKLQSVIRGDLDWIVMKALEKDRTRRYETANGFAADIQRHLNNEPVVARPPSNLYRFQKMVKRNKFAVAAAGLIALALLLGIIGSTWQAVRATRAEREQSRLRVEAENSEKKAQLEASKSEQVARFLKKMLNGVGPSVAIGRDTALLKEILENTAKSISAELANQPEVEAELRFTLGQIYWELGDLQNAEANHRMALSLRTNIFGIKNPQVALSMRRLSHVLWRRGRLDEAEKMGLVGLAIQRELLGNTNLEVAGSLQDLSAIMATKNNYADAEKMSREAVAINTTILGHDTIEVADALSNLGGVLYVRVTGKAAEALDIFREALAIRRKLLGEENPFVTILALRIEIYELEAEGKFNEAAVKLKKTLEVQRTVFGNEHPDIAQTLNRFAMILREDGKLPESESYRRDALAMQRKLLGDDSSEVAQTLFDLGTTLASENKLSQAEDNLREALTLRSKLFGHQSGLTGSALGSLGGVLEKEGKYEEAMKLYLQAADGTSPRAAASQLSLGVMYQNGKGVKMDLAEAIKWFRKSADLGNRVAQCTLAMIYMNGSGVPKNQVEAAKFFQKAAEQGHGLAQSFLGWFYASGSGGLPKDMKLAFQWRSKSAEQGNSAGQVSLAQMYLYGEGVEVDFAKAAQWFRRAAEQGSANAKIALAQMYEKGSGVPKDEEEAKTLRISAARSSDTQVLNDVAWTLATSQNAAMRDGTNALIFAEKAVNATARKNAAYLDTLAAAYAEVGNFTNAIAVQSEAMALLKDEKNKADFATRLKLYEANIPYHSTN